MNEDVERLGAAIAYHRQPLRYFLDTGIPNAEGILRRFKESLNTLYSGIAEAGEDVEGMRILARRACAAQEIADIQFRSAMDILGVVSAEIAATGKE